MDMRDFIFWGVRFQRDEGKWLSKNIKESYSGEGLNEGKDSVDEGDGASHTPEDNYTEAHAPVI